MLASSKPFLKAFKSKMLGVLFLHAVKQANLSLKYRFVVCHHCLPSSLIQARPIVLPKSSLSATRCTRTHIRRNAHHCFSSWDGRRSDTNAIQDKACSVLVTSFLCAHGFSDQLGQVAVGLISAFVACLRMLHIGLSRREAAHVLCLATSCVRPFATFCASSSEKIDFWHCRTPS